MRRMNYKTGVFLAGLGMMAILSPASARAQSVNQIDPALADAHWKAKGIDLSSILYAPTVPSRVARRRVQAQDHGLDTALDHKLISQAAPALEFKTPVTGSFAIRNVHRTVGAMLGGEIAMRYGSAGLPDGTIHYKFHGSAGQSAWSLFDF